MTTRAPDSVADLQAFVRDSERVHVVGNGSKSALHCAVNGAAIADLSGMSGIIEYQPSEYTATVRAGTPVRELNAALREKGQYLPFDPLLPEEATLGGTVASNLSGSPPLSLWRRTRFHPGRASGGWRRKGVWRRRQSGQEFSRLRP